MPCHLLWIDAVFPTPPQKKKSFVEALTRNVMVSQGPLGGDSVVRPGRRSEGIRALIRRPPRQRPRSPPPSPALRLPPRAPRAVGKGRARTRQQGRHPYARKWVLARRRPRRPPVVGSRPPELRGNKRLLFKPPACGVFHGSRSALPHARHVTLPGRTVAMLPGAPVPATPSHLRTGGSPACFERQA